MYLLCNDPDPILTAAKKYRCRCEGVCNEYVINGESTISEGYQQRNVSIIKIFLYLKNTSYHVSTKKMDSFRLLICVAQIQK